jgi:hypothetical protein
LKTFLKIPVNGLQNFPKNSGKLRVGLMARQFFGGSHAYVGLRIDAITPTSSFRCFLSMAPPTQRPGNRNCRNIGS